MLYEEDKHKNRARMGHILGYFRQFAPSRTLEAQAIINPTRFGKYAKNHVTRKALPGAIGYIAQTTTNILTKDLNQQSTEPEPYTEAFDQSFEDLAKSAETAPTPAKKTRGRKSKDQCCG